MRIQTFSILAGSTACNACCPFCVSKRTPNCGVQAKPSAINWRNFRKACLLAKTSGVTTAMITGKGEPTLFPNQITRYLEELSKHDFPLIDLQTNGIALAESEEKRVRLSGELDLHTPVTDEHLAVWYNLGLTTIALSVVHWKRDKNKKIYGGKHYDLENLIKKLHKIGFSVRLSCVMLGGYVDHIEEVELMNEFARHHEVEQLTLTPVSKPAKDLEFGNNVKPLEWNATREMKVFLDHHGTKVMELSHGAIVYDFKGQNVCLSNCLSPEPTTQELRNLIFFPDGHLRWDWQFEGAILL